MFFGHKSDHGISVDDPKQFQNPKHDHTAHDEFNTNNSAPWRRSNKGDARIIPEWNTGNMCN